MMLQFTFKQHGGKKGNWRGYILRMQVDDRPKDDRWIDRQTDGQIDDGQIVNREHTSVIKY